MITLTEKATMFKDILVNATTIPSRIRLNQKILKLKLCDKNLSFYEAFRFFNIFDERIFKLAREYVKVKSILSNLDEIELTIAKCLLQGISYFKAATKIGISSRTYYRKLSKLADKFLLKYKQGENYEVKC